MALRKPSALPVLGTRLFVKDPNAVADSYFDSYRFVPNLGAITMPDEAPDQNDIVMMEGSVAIVGEAGVGQITAPIPGLSADPTHQFMEEKRRNKEDVQVIVRRPGSKKITLDTGLLVAVAAEGVSVVSAAAGIRNQVINNLRDGMTINIGDSEPGTPVYLAYGAGGHCCLR